MRDVTIALGAFTAIAYLAMRGGGYDQVIRGEFGLALWWAALLGLIAGFAAPRRPPTAAIAMIGILATLALWSTIGISWSDSAERSVTEVVRVVILLGAAAIVMLFGGPRAPRSVLFGAGGAIAAVAAIALLSRSIPDWFPDDIAAEFLPTATRNRLNYPLTYWNGLGALIAIGIPLVIYLSATLRRPWGAVWAAAMPVMGLALFLTLSRGGAAAAVVGILALIFAGRSRAHLLLTALNLGVATAILAWQAESRSAYSDNLLDQAAEDQGLEMLAWVAVVAAGAALAQYLINRSPRRFPWSWRAAPAATRRRLLVAGAVVGALLLAGAGASGKLADGWDEFKGEGSVGTADDSSRLTTISGNNRYEYWDASVQAFLEEPVTGLGPGNWEFWWARTGAEGAAFARDGHSLYLEALAELGPIGLALTLALVGLPLLVLGLRASWRPIDAPLFGAVAAFALAAGLDWAWEMTVVPVAFLIVALAGLIASSEPESEAPGRRWSWGWTAAALLASVALLASLAGDRAIRQSQSAAFDGDLERALELAEEAEDLKPFAAAPKLQRALVLERAGDLGGAAEAARDAADAEPVNWRHWFILARVESELGNDSAAAEAIAEAERLNPRSPLFAD